MYCAMLVIQKNKKRENKIMNPRFCEFYKSQKKKKKIYYKFSDCFQHASFNLGLTFFFYSSIESNPIEC